MTKRRIWALLLLGIVWMATAAMSSAQTLAPASAAEQMRAMLFQAQLALTTEPQAAQADIATAETIYAGVFTAVFPTTAPSAHTQVEDGFVLAETAVATQNELLLAQARAQIQTGLLAGSYQVVMQAIAANAPDQAQQWLPLREYRPTTRFSRPNVTATVAMSQWANGEISAEDAALAVQADLLDTYQFQLTDSLAALKTADQAGFSLRRVEHAALAQGYFAMLAPAFAEQRGAEAAAAMSQQFINLVETAVSGQDLTPILEAITPTLETFRAAPLSPAEQVRRAGQLLRFLSLVPVEYERGVRGGVVTSELEIQEAVTFQAGAAAAFADLQSVLAELNADDTAVTATKLDALNQLLHAAMTGSTVADPAQIETLTAELEDQLATLLPEEWQTGSLDGDFDVIASLLDQMETAVAQNEYALAESARLEAYAMLEVGPEARLIAFAPEAIPPLENLFWNGQEENAGLAYLIRNEAPLAEIRATRQALDGALANAQSALSRSSAPEVTAVNAAIIVFREGLEAVLILASLMASFKAGEGRKLRRPMWLGAGLALVASVITWIGAQELLSTLARYGERLEAAVSLVAIVVLLLITNWFFHKVYWTGWMANFHSQKRRLLNAEASLWLGLLTLGFTSIYREGFESVLFLQALVLESGTAVVLLGTLAGLLGAALVGVIVFALQARLPYRQMLVYTGVLIGMVLLVMVGHTVHVWQVVGWFPIHPIRWLSLPYWTGSWFGIFATWEGLGLQLAAAAFVIGSYYLAEALQARKREQIQKRHVPSPTA
ncbi:MAG: FTR1 family protein [Ardenticatenaceae bacterium]|nr:FTR1 family protein [Ardenticatenaceae bacterium]